MQCFNHSFTEYFYKREMWCYVLLYITSYNIGLDWIGLDWIGLDMIWYNCIGYDINMIQCVCHCPTVSTITTHPPSAFCFLQLHLNISYFNHNIIFHLPSFAPFSLLSLQFSFTIYTHFSFPFPLPLLFSTVNKSACMWCSDGQRSAVHRRAVH